MEVEKASFGNRIEILTLVLLGIGLELILWISLKLVGKNPDDYFDIDDEVLE